MKLTVWQQFSSNHSASFTMVGEFETTQAAKHALERLRGFLERVNAWIKDYPCNVIFSNEFEGKELTDEELLFFHIEDVSAEFSVVEWVYSISEKFNEVLIQQDNFVLINSHSEWTHGGRPFDELLQKWGAKIYLESELLNEGGFVLNFESRFLREAEAEKVEKKIMRERNKTYPIWSRFYGGQFVDIETFEHDIAGFEQNKQMRKELSQLYFDIEQSQNQTTKERLKRDRQRLGDDYHKFCLTEYERVLRTNVYIKIGRTPKLIRRDANVLIAQAWKLDGEELAMGFPAFLAWLKSEGAEVSYSFEKLSGRFEETE